MAEASPRFVFVHGVTLEGGNGRHAAAVREALGAEGLQIECPDFTDGEFAARPVGDALAMIDALAQGGKVALVYHSYGAFICHLYASRHPERVVACFGLAPTPNVRALLESFDEAAMRKWRESGRSSSPPKSGEPPKIVSSYAWCDSILSLPPSETTPQPLCPVILVVPSTEVDSKAPLLEGVPPAASPRCMLVVEDGHFLDATLPEVTRELAGWAHAVAEGGEQGALARMSEQTPQWAVRAQRSTAAPGAA